MKRRIGLVLGCVAVSLFAGEARAQDVPGKLRIEDAVQLALTRNERAKISELNERVAEVAVTRAVSPFLPTAILNANDSQRPDDVVRQGPTNIGNASVTITQPILNIAAIPLLAQARRNYEGQKAQTLDDKRLLSFDAAKAFFAVLSVDEVLTSALEKLDTSQKNLKVASDRVDAHLNSTNDVSRAQIDLGGAEREVELDRGSEKGAFIALGFVINVPASEVNAWAQSADRPVGSPSGSALVPPEAILHAARDPLPRSDTLLQVALAHRPDLAAKRRFALAAHDFAREPLWRLFPTVGLSGTFSLTTNTAARPPAPAPLPNDEFLQATLIWPIYDAGIRYADKHSRDAQAEIADLTVDTLLRSVDADVRNAVANLEASQAALGASERAMVASQKSLEESKILYDQGLAKAIELVDANDQRFLAEVNYSAAQYSTALAYLGLRQALGLDPIGTELK